MKKSHRLSLFILGLLVIALSFEVIRDAFTKQGDFAGYVLVGNLAMEGKDIYANPLINTWPPFFTIVSIPIAIVDNFNPQTSRLLWLLLSLVALFFSIQFLSRLSIGRDLNWNPFQLTLRLSAEKISIAHWLILTPILISFRFVLDNLSSIQINIFMLFLCIYSIFLFAKEKELLAGLLLAFAISIKVYPIFLMLYFFVKREFKFVGLTFLFTLLFCCIPFLFFSYDQTLNYYVFWYEYNVVPFASVAHKNQSFFSMMRSLLMHESPGLNQPLKTEIYLNIMDLSIGQVKLISYGIIAMVGSNVMYLFRNKLVQKDGLKSLLEYAFILTITPILSPLAWKAFFVFLLPGYFLSCLLLFHMKIKLSTFTRTLLLVNFYGSILLTVFSSELFLGKYVSDLFEAFSCITIGTILLAINLVIMYVNYDKGWEMLKRLERL